LGGGSPEKNFPDNSQPEMSRVERRKGFEGDTRDQNDLILCIEGAARKRKRTGVKSQGVQVPSFSLGGGKQKEGCWEKGPQSSLLGGGKKKAQEGGKDSSSSTKRRENKLEKSDDSKYPS